MPIKKPAEKTTNRGRHRSRGEVVLYKSQDGGAALQVRIDKETVWLTQRQMAQLFGKDTDTVGLHIRNAYKEGELEEIATTEDSSVVQREGGRTVRRTVRRLKELRQSLKLVGKVLNGYDVTSDQTKALPHVVTDYSRALDLLDDYDHQRVARTKGRITPARGIDYDEAQRIIDRLRTKFRAPELFGREKDAVVNLTVSLIGGIA